jgi:hypothetical protein
MLGYCADVVNLWIILTGVTESNAQIHVSAINLLAGGGVMAVSLTMKGSN